MAHYCKLIYTCMYNDVSRVLAVAVDLVKWIILLNYVCLGFDLESCIQAGEVNHAQQ